MADVLPFARKHPGQISDNILVRWLSRISQVPPPDALRPFHLASEGERRRRVRRVLVEARRSYRSGAVSVLDAIDDAAAPLAGVEQAAGEYAKIELRRTLLEINLHAWERHPARLRADVHSALRRTIGRLTPHRGGWLVRR